MLGSVAAVVVAIAAIVPRVPEVDFTPVIPVGDTQFDVTVIAEAESGVRHLVRFTCTQHATAEDARDAAALQLKGSGWDVRVVGETKLLVVGYKGSLVTQLDFETTNGTQPVGCRVVAPTPWPRAGPRDTEAVRRERLANVRQSIAGLQGQIQSCERRVGQLRQPDAVGVARLQREAERYWEEVKKLRAEEYRLWAQQPGGIIAPAPRPVAPNK